MSRSQLPLNALRAFEAAARHASFTHAAEELHVTQAAVSHQVKALEERLGVALFVRRPRGLEITGEGQALLPDLRDAFDRMTNALERVGRKANSGTLNVSLVTTFALACELQADWKRPVANDMLAPFNQNLSEYGFVLQNFWNNANQHVVPDPFGMVK